MLKARCGHDPNNPTRITSPSEFDDLIAPRESSRKEPPTAAPIFDFDQTENCPSCWNSGTGRGPSNNRANRRTPLETKELLAMIWSSRRAGSILANSWNCGHEFSRSDRTHASRKILRFFGHMIRAFSKVPQINIISFVHKIYSLLYYDFRLSSSLLFLREN